MKVPQPPIVTLFDLKHDLDEALADIHRGIDRLDHAVLLCNNILETIGPAKLAMPATATVIENMVQAILIWLELPELSGITEVTE